jgi:hypothetical protein
MLTPMHPDTMVGLVRQYQHELQRQAAQRRLTLRVRNRRPGH